MVRFDNLPSQEHHQMQTWLRANVGREAVWPGFVSKVEPWYVRKFDTKVIYFFLNEKDATLFTLKWVK